MSERGAVRRPAVAVAAAIIAGLVGAAELGGPAWGWGLGALAVAGGARLVRGRGRRSLALLAIALLGGCRFVDAERRAEQRVALLRAAEGAVEAHLLGRVLRGAEPTRDGEHLLTIRGRADAGGASLTVRLRVRRSHETPTAGLRRLRRGDTVRVWCRLRLPRPMQNPASPDPLRALRARGLDARGTVKSAWLVTRLASGPARPASWIDGVRVVIRERIERTLDAREPAVRAVAAAMLLGQRAALSPQTWRTFRDAGLAHLLAISGLHVGLIALLVVGSLRRAGLGARGTLLVAGVALVAVCFGVGGGSPVTRATTTAILLLAGRAIGRDGDALNALAVVVSLLLLHRPWGLWTPGFQLTFLATAGILLLAPRLVAHGRGPRGVVTAGAVSTAAYAATAPLVAYHFQHLAPVGLLSNLAAAPLCAVTLVATPLGLLLADAPWVGEAASRVAGLGPSLLLGGARWAAGLPAPAAFAVAPPPAWLWPALGLAGLAFTGGRPGAIATRLTVAAGLLLHIGPPPAGPGASRAWLPDVGQGQAVVLRGPSGGFVVVDAGGSGGGRFDMGERVVRPLLLRLGCRRIERLIVTHHHDDHAGGARALIEGFEVGELMLGAGALREPATAALVDAALRRGAALVLGERGDVARRAGLPLRVLHPDRLDRRRGLDANERSVVVLAGVAPHRILIAGDVERDGETAMLRRSRRPRAEALVVGHHGARRATGQPWLRAVAPELALISVGRSNRFGHPSPEVLARLRHARVEVHRTDREGMLRLEAAAGGWHVISFRRSAPEEQHGQRDERRHEDQQQ